MDERVPDDQTTLNLIRRTRDGDRAAMDELLRHVWPRIEGWIRRERGEAVRSRFDTIDCAQDVALGLVRYLPDVSIGDRETFHRILYRMIQNSLRNKYDYLMARRRRLTLEKPLAIDGPLELDPPDTRDSPSIEAGKAEMRAWIRFALALLPADEQELIFRRQFDGEAFADIGRALDLDPDAARMRFNRAMLKLNSLIRRLQQGDANALFASEDDAEA